MSCYTPPNNEYLSQRTVNVLDIFTDFVNKHKTPFIDDVKIDMDSLCDCILRVHQRRHYFEIFHDTPNGLSEVKMVSLYCFWLLKYKPFLLFFNEKSLAEKDIWQKRYFLERFCLYWLTATLRSLYKARGMTKLPLSEKGTTDLLYSLKHHDIAKETLTEIFELLEDIIKNF